MKSIGKPRVLVFREYTNLTKEMNAMIRFKRLSSICLAFALLLSSIPLTVFADGYVVGILTVFSSINGASSSYSFETLGHSWISFYNSTSSTLKIGAYNVAPMEEVTIGKWNIDPNEPEYNHRGIWYNREAEKINLR